MSEFVLEKHISDKIKELLVSKEKNFIRHHKVDTGIRSVQFYYGYLLIVTFIQHVLILCGIIVINYVKK
jgi:hypothetical protein